LNTGSFSGALAVVGEDLSRPLLRLPQVDERQAVLAEEAGDVVAPVRRHQAVVGLAADTAEFRQLRCARRRQVGDPDLAGVEQGVGELVARHVGQADNLRKLFPVAELCRNVGEQFQRLRIEDLDAARLVILRGHQAAVL
jgi:hypothetical protein